MEIILFLLGVGPGPDLARLGADEYRTREAEHQRCDNLLFALLLPNRHEDPEINHRLRALRSKNLKWFDPKYIERAIRARDSSAWIRMYVLEGESVAWTLDEVFREIHQDNALASTYFALAPCHHAHQGFLRGSILAGEFESFTAHRQSWKDRQAPRPREK